MNFEPTAMNRQSGDIEPLIFAKYARDRAQWSDIQILTRYHCRGHGHFVVVKYRDDKKLTHDEMCFVDEKGEVRLFDTTAELASQIEKIYALKNWFFSGQGIAAITFLVLLLALILQAFLQSPAASKEIFDVLRTILMLAAGFFFGSQALSRRG